MCMCVRAVKFELPELHIHANNEQINIVQLF